MTCSVIGSIVLLVGLVASKISHATQSAVKAEVVQYSDHADHSGIRQASRELDRQHTSDDEYRSIMLRRDRHLLGRIREMSDDATQDPSLKPGSQQAIGAWERQRDALREQIEKDSFDEAPVGSIQWDMKRQLERMNEDAPSSDLPQSEHITPAT